MSILLIDSYDSFTYNLKNLLQESTGALILTIHNDSYSIPGDEEILTELIDSMNALVIGPGPGNPDDPTDVGIIPFVYENFPNVPVLGICLGFQTMCLNYGLKVDYLKEPIHGQIHSISTTINSKEDLYKGFERDFNSVRYHSIFVVDDEKIGDVVPLAYYKDLESGTKVLMAGKHPINPHFGVQYHPESICSSGGSELVTNFWKIAKDWNSSSGRIVNQVSHDKDRHIVHEEPLIDHYINSTEYDYQFKEISLDGFGNDILCLCEFIKSENDNRNDFLLLNSAMFPGDWSIIGLPIAGHSDVITHSTEKINEIHITKWGTEETTEIRLNHHESVWSYTASYMKDKYFEPQITNDLLMDCPFVGGLIGFFSYEEGDHIVLNKLDKLTKSDIPDTKLCFIERFIVIHHSKCFIVTIKKNDSKWLDSFTDKISNSKFSEVNKSIHSVLPHDLNLEIIKPDKQSYLDSFDQCQRYLKAGDSYELCLTRPTLIKVPKLIQSWEIYKNLVDKNPSPYSAFLDFGDANLLSTSPERFLFWDNNKSQMRPIKGTVKKTPEITYEKACKLLKIPKEIGENLMIVDLIRHDLYQFLDKVEVTKLMSVEQYKTVYQLVSVIEGHLNNSKFKGIDLLYKSLPPGSMTGAPKKRSIELLHVLELNQRRGLYSGVSGYWSVNNKSDWSVIIRSLFNYSDDLESNEDIDCWRCGAGGAITVLSTASGEWDEMLVKLDSVLQMFQK